MVDAVAVVRAYREGDFTTAAEIIHDAEADGSLLELAGRLALVAEYAMFGWELADEEAVERGMWNLGRIASITPSAPRV